MHALISQRHASTPDLREAVRAHSLLLAAFLVLLTLKCVFYCLLNLIPLKSNNHYCCLIFRLTIKPRKSYLKQTSPAPGKSSAHVPLAVRFMSQEEEDQRTESLKMSGSMTLSMKSGLKEHPC